MRVEDLSDPYVQFVCMVAQTCAETYPEEERIFAPFFVGWLELAIQRALMD